MTRGVGLIFAVISLAITGALFALQSKSQGPTSAAATHAESQALATAASAGFAPVDQFLQLAHAQNGTYVGAALPAGTGVTVVGASSTNYCLELTLDSAVVHETGPGGSPAAGRC